jgi:ABC-2 type transport system ATP-binding protein
MSEMALTADHLIVIGRGRLIADCGVNEFVGSSERRSVRVRSPQLPDLVARLQAAGAAVNPGTDGAIEVTGLEASAVGELAAAGGLVLHELTPVRASLEEAFMEVTRDSVEFHASGVTAP